MITNLFTRKDPSALTLVALSSPWLGMTIDVVAKLALEFHFHRMTPSPPLLFCTVDHVDRPQLDTV